MGARKTGQQRGCPGKLATHNNLLLVQHKMPTTILLPAGLIRFCAEWLLFPEADRLDPVCRHAGCDQRVLDGAGTVVAQSQVVLGRTAFIAVALHRDTHVRVLLQESRIGLHESLLVRANICLVLVEIDILHVLGKELLVGEGWSRGWWGRGRCVHRHPGGGGLRSTRAFGRQGIGR